MHKLAPAGLLTLAPLLAGAPRIQAPDAPWKTFRTPHYRIHFPARGDFEPFAREVASKIEGIHAQVVDWVGYASPKPVQVFIRDPILEANGSAWAFLDHPWVELWKTPPEPEGAVGHHRNWVDLVVTHELVHVHHLTRPQNDPDWRDRLLDSPLGPLARKAPRWVVEGYATVLEGRITGSGRPHSAYRAAQLRQWALEGKLPDYGTLNGFQGFRGGSQAYLVGSAFLEWLEGRNPGSPDLLKTFWKRLASKRHRDFQGSFEATFGQPPREAYDRWRAEVTHDALELERRAKAQGLLREGEPWARVEGEVTDLAVSPDGKRLLARVLTEGFRGLRVWELGEPKASEPRRPAPADPQEPEDRQAGPPKRPFLALGRVAGAVPWKPRWVDPRTIHVSLRLPDGEGSLQERPWTWSLPGGAEGTAPAPSDAAAEAPLRVEREGFWNIYLGSRPLTRTLSAAWNPAPTPDGRWLYYTQLRATGVEIRRLDLDLPPLEDVPLPQDPEPLAPATVLSKADEPSRLPDPVAAPEPQPYQALAGLWNRSRSGLGLSPSGTNYQIGWGGSDGLERISWMALAGLGDGAGPRGATVAAAWRGWRWAPSLALFSSLERPSAQRFLPVAGLDRERRGAALAFMVEGRSTWPWFLRPVAAWEHSAFLEEPRPTLDRALGGIEGGLRHRWGWGEKAALSLLVDGRLLNGRTAGKDWNLQRASLRIGLAHPWLPVALRGEVARLGGRPSRVDLLQIGGAECSLVPSALEPHRFFEDPLPAYATSGDRARRWRAEAGEALVAYLAEDRAWTAGLDRPGAQRFLGLEFRWLDRIPPQAYVPLLGRIRLVLGLHRGLEGLLRQRTVGTLSLVLRP